MSFVVGIGASAGGLEAIGKFFSNMPPREDVSFVVVQHLSPNYKSLMNELLVKFTSRRITIVENPTIILPGEIYLIPPRNHISIISDTLYLNEYEKNEALHLPIDNFFHSLAIEKKESSIGIVLSGTGSDGTRGIISIKNAGGIVIAQSIDSAQFSGMPSNAIKTGLVDLILSPEIMGEKLSEIIDNCYNDPTSYRKTKLDPTDQTLIKIFDLISDEIQLDLTYYKQNTVQRRLERRMEINNKSTIHEYYLLLRNSSAELKALCNDMLIGVTQFFRDFESFEYLKDTIIPEIFQNKAKESPLRIWVAGCSTGEEAYSLAILFHDYISKNNLHQRVKIFASDIDKNSLEIASAGFYNENSIHTVPTEFLEKYFVFTGTGYKVSKEIREMIVFSQHNLIKDPPFNRIDLLTCRNLLIYLQPILQKKILGFFSYALNLDGYLFLGSSETVGENASTFITVHSNYKIFQHVRKHYIQQNDIEPLISKVPTNIVDYTYLNKSKLSNPLDALYKLLVHEYFQSTIIVDKDFNVLLICGKANEYLSMAKGQPSTIISKMIDNSMLTPLMTALRRVFKDNLESKFNFKKLTSEGMFSIIEVSVSLLPELRSFPKIAAISFTENIENRNRTEVIQEPISIDANKIIKELELDLQYSSENLQAIMEEHETSNEELQAVNEELLSSNEELQSTNEELQAVNEELITLNAEYQYKIIELSDLSNDMDNYLSATNIGVIFLDTELNIRKYTESAATIINLISSDIGRSISHFSHNIKDMDIMTDSKKVLETLTPLENEVETKNGEYYIMKIYPFKTRENFIKGLTLTFVNITDLYKAEKEIIRLRKE